MIQQSVLACLPDRKCARCVNFCCGAKSSACAQQALKDHAVMQLHTAAHRLAKHYLLACVLQQPLWVQGGSVGSMPLCSGSSP
jgi:hypothetical protein